MAYFTISLNGHVVACAGWPDIRVLSAHIIASAFGPAQLSASGMSVADGQVTHLCWPSWALSPNDQVAITFTALGQATAPTSIFKEAELPPKEALARLRERYEQPPQSPRQSFSHTRARRHARLTVLTPAGASVEASLGEAEQLQAVVSFVRSACNAEVDSLTVQPDGSTRGARWLQLSIEPEQTITFTYAA